MKMPNALRPALRRFSSNAQHLDQEIHHRAALLRGSVPLYHQGPRHPISPPNLSLRFEVRRLETARHDWAFIWTHGLTSSVESEDEGGWPFSGVAHLSDLLPVVRYDARGHGRSADAIEPTWPAMGSDLCKMHEKMFPKGRIILGGTSMGAAASLYAALEAPEKVEALVLATPPTAWETRKKFVPLYQESLALAEKQGLEAAKSVAETKARPPIFLETERGRASFDIGWRQKFSMGQRRYCAALRGAIDSDLPSPEALRRLNIPVLILAWKSDAQHPLESALMLQEILPQAELCVADSWEEIERFPEQIRGFLLNLL
ncbi:unnamed protein product [Durusdinium trenchii]|uniref:AB hydrolase-1 domain-containing protein n=2 Tax=Durusdinium trenchii TaxID=1381693 RepID=A0ABP0KUI1_9DINO